jgi:stage V sporulation protein SpoVS
MRELNSKEVQAVSGGSYTQAALGAIASNFVQQPLKTLFIAPFALILAIGVDLFYPGAAL